MRIEQACCSTGCAWCCTKDVVLELFLFSKYLTTLKYQIELLVIRLHTDSSFSIERVGAFRSVKGLGPTIEIKKKKYIWNKIKLLSFSSFAPKGHLVCPKCVDIDYISSHQLGMWSWTYTVLNIIHTPWKITSFFRFFICKSYYAGTSCVSFVLLLLSTNPRVS